MAHTVDLSDVEPGRLRVYSKVEPPLSPGAYGVSITQSYGSQLLETTKSFHVVQPPLSIAPSNIHSYYPIAGTSEHAKILPHISFTDPFLPWARNVSSGGAAASTGPWLALVSFEVGELSLQSKQIQSLTKVTAARASHIGLATVKTAREPLTPSSTGALSLTAEELLALKDSGELQVAYSRALAADEQREPSAMLQAIVLTKDLATALLGESNDDANAWVTTGKANTERYSHLAHLRQINNTGLKDRTTTGATQDIVSTLICHRTGPPQLRRPAKMVVHVISLDGVNELDLKSGVDAICLISLHSWTYWCVPESHKSFRDSMKALIGTIQPLAYAKDQLDLTIPSDNGGSEAQWLRKRLEAGYTIMRSVVQTGEPTLATVRGFCSPYRPLVQSRQPSNDGNSLQILDKEVGMMDLTYSTAWNAGRTSALASPGFSQALLRIRATMHETALIQAKKEIDTSFMTKAELVSELNRLGREISANLSSLENLALNGRWRTSDTTAGPPLREDVSWFNPTLQQKFGRTLLGLSDVLRKHRLSDLQTVSDWVLNTLRLKDLPPCYLVPDVRMLPHESIRTFYLDDAWSDAYIDGALSVGNHYDDEDVARSVIKKHLNEVLGEKDNGGSLVQQRKIPRWGLLIRSEQMIGNQDFIVSVRGSSDCFMSSVKLAEDIRMFLFTRYPEDPDFSHGDDKAIVISQPPHQQRFSLVTLSESIVECSIFGIKSSESFPAEIYKHWQASWPAQGDRHGVSDDKHDLPPIYNWSTRSLVPQQLSKGCVSVLQARMPGSDLLTDISQSHLSSAALGLQLNEAVFDVVISTSKCVKESTPPTVTPTKAFPFAAKDPDAHRDSSTNLPPKPSAPQPVVVRTAVPFDIVKPGPGMLGPAIISNGVPVFHDISVWPVLTRRKAIPASRQTPIDLIFALPSAENVPPAVSNHTFHSSISITIEIPTGTGATDLFTQIGDPPRVRMLSKSMRWKASVVVPDPEKRDTLRITIDTYAAAAGNTNVKNIEDDPSFVLGPVSNITGEGRVLMTCTVSVRPSAGATPSTAAFGAIDAVKEKVPDGKSWP